jgi:hypothetical protein
MIHPSQLILTLHGSRWSYISFFKVDSGMVEFVTWDLLSAYIKEGQVNGIPIMQSS